MVRRTKAQVEALLNPHQPPGVKRRARAIAEPSPVHGVRPDRTWVRHGAVQVRPELTSHELVDALEWMHARRGREMTIVDVETLAELDVRAWGWGEVQDLRTWTLPTWSDELVPRRRSAGYTRFLALVLAAYRAGAVGVLLGYHECMALVGTKSRDTWRRWSACMEAAGLVRIVQTWKSDPTSSTRHRSHAKLLYRLGPAWEAAAGPGLCEGAAGGEGEVSATWAARLARGARVKARAERDGRRCFAWAANRNDPRFARKRDERTKPVLEAFRSSGSTPPVAMQGGQSAPPPCVGGTGDDLRASPSGATSATPPASAATSTPRPDRDTKPAPAPSGRRGRRALAGQRDPRSPIFTREASQAAPSSPIGDVRPVSPELVEREVTALLQRARARDLPLQRGASPPASRRVQAVHAGAVVSAAEGGELVDDEPRSDAVVSAPSSSLRPNDSAPPARCRNDSAPPARCRVCAGHGFVGPWTCGDCKGTGASKRPRPPPPCCSACKGAGLDHATGNVCETCNGAGHE